MARRLKDSPNYENIVKSLDFRFGRRQVLVMIVAALLGILISMLKYPDPEEKRIFMIVAAAIFGPAILWYLIRWLDIFIKPDHYIFFTAVLDQPNLGYKRGIYYTIHGIDREGRPIVANTRKIFGTLFAPTFEEYNNLKVLVGYNERTGRTIVVRKAIYD